jgi:hypothetical protein
LATEFSARSKLAALQKNHQLFNEPDHLEWLLIASSRSWQCETSLGLTA